MSKKNSDPDIPYPVLAGFHSFKFEHEVGPQEPCYDYYESHPEHKSRPLSRVSCVVNVSAEADCMGAEGPRVIAGQIVEYGDLMAAVRNRVAELNIHGTRFDAMAGWPEGYLSKLICVRPVRRIGLQSMGVLLSTLGVSLQMIENPAGTERLKERLVPRNPRYVRAMPAAAGIVFTARMLKRIRRLGGKARMARLTPEQRSELGRKAAAARWKKGEARPER